MLLVQSLKILALSMLSITLGGATVGTGILFAGFLLGFARNPEEHDQLYNNTLMAFALLETFVFMSFIATVLALVIF